MAAALPLFNALSAPILTPGLYAGTAEPAVPSALAVGALEWAGQERRCWYLPASPSILPIRVLRR